MDNILSVDISDSAVEFTLVSIEAHAISVTESKRFEFPAPEASLVATENPLGDAESLDAVIQSSPAARIASHSKALKELVQQLPRTWSHAAVTFTPGRYLAVGLSLPFGEQANIDRVIDLEVQDRIPFDIDSFIVHGNALLKEDAGTFRVHAALTERDEVQALLASLRDIGIEAAVLTPVSSALQALAALAPDYFPQNSVLMELRDGALHLALRAHGIFQSDRVISLAKTAQGTLDFGAMTSAIKMSVFSFEREHSVQLEKVCCLVPPGLLAELRSALGRPIEKLTLDEFIKGATPTTPTGTAATIFIPRPAISKPLSNFRTREFSYRPDFTPLLRTLYRLRVLFGVVAAATLAALFLVYHFRELRIEKLEAGIRQQIVVALPQLASSNGNEVSAFQTEIIKLTKELENLGSPTSLSPLHTFVELSKDLDGQTDLTVNGIDIRTDGVKLDVSAPDYSAGERLERVLRKKKELYCHIKRDTGSAVGAQNSRSFIFDIRLCE